ncbi:MAG: hypothetical protein A2719_01745 [Candidatus Ryanbacteria bacterium RIFCSPHIGHO2_01_FULL_45_22]|nr:MAG: hypothetical protein A2719_01745 [Candidatus Ryanbacteria bacterium RIFCSPHIGHO2_01_FULL_45_22]
MERIPIGIVGVGMVGGQLTRYFLDEQKYQRGKELFLFDKDPAKGYADDVNAASIVFVCVPTPRRGDTGACDLSILEDAVRMLKKPKVVVLKSTIPPGTTEQVQHAYPQHAFLFNPEFLTESRAWEDMLRPDRQVVGYTSKSLEQASTVLQLLPKAFFSSPGTLGTYTFTRVNATEAELGKYAGNTFGALKVAFANILADFCGMMEAEYKRNGEDVPVQYDNVRMILAHDHRIGDAWLDVDHGLYRGFGGYCFPKDVSALIAHGKELLEKLPENHPHKNQYEKGIRLLEAMWEYNKELLAGQNLTIDDVSVHDKEWVEKKVKKYTT